MFPYASDMFYHFVGKTREVAAINHQIKAPFDVIMKKRPNSFQAGMDILDNARKHKKPIEFVTLKDGSEGVVYHDKDQVKRILTNPEVINDLKNMRNTFKKILNMEEASIRDLLPFYQIDRRSSSAEIIASADSLQKDLDGIHPSIPGYFKLENSIKTLRAISGMLDQISVAKTRDYVPHIRFGKRMITVIDKDTGKKVGVWTMEESKGSVVNRHQLKNAREAVAKYLNNPKYKVIGYDNPGHMTYNDLFDGKSVDKADLESLYSVIGEGDVESYKLLQEEIQKVTGESSLPYHFRASEGMEGYSTDWRRVLETYTNGVALSMINRKYKGAEAKYDTFITNLNKDVPGTSVADKEFLRKTYDYLRSPESDFLGVRALNFIGTLGFNFSTAALQLLNTPINGVATVLPFSPDGWLRSMGRSTAAYKDAMLFSKVFNWEMSSANPNTEHGKSTFDSLIKKRVFSEDTLRNVEAMQKMGVIGAIILDENIATGYDAQGFGGTVKSALEQTTRMAGAMTAYTERQGRLATAFFLDRSLRTPEHLQRALDTYGDDPGYLQMRQKHPSLTGKQAMMAYLIDRIHGMYGKIGRGSSQRGLFGATLGAFTTYPIQQFENFANLASKGGVKSILGAAHMIGSIAFIAGIQGIPGYIISKNLYNLVNKLYESLWEQYPDGPPHDFDEDTREFFASLLGPEYADWVMKGPMRNISGIDISGRVTLPTPIEAVLNKMVKATGAVVDTGGQLSDLGATPLDVISKVSNLGMRAIPAVNNIYTAAQINPANPMGVVKTAGGMPVANSRDPLSGEPTFEQSEALSQMVGFTPTKLSKMRELNTMGAKERTAITESNRKYMDMAVEAMTEQGRYMRMSERPGISDTQKEAYERRAQVFAKKHAEIVQNYKKYNISVGINNPDSLDIFNARVLQKYKERLLPAPQMGLSVTKDQNASQKYKELSKSELYNPDASVLRTIKDKGASEEREKQEAIEEFQ
jgi:hypothetical protein